MYLYLYICSHLLHISWDNLLFGQAFRYLEHTDAASLRQMRAAEETAILESVDARKVDSFFGLPWLTILDSPQAL